MGDEYMDAQDSSMNDSMNRNGDSSEGPGDNPKDFGDGMGYDECYDDDEGGNNFRGNRGRGNFRNRGRGPPPNWMNGPPPMRFRGRGYGPGGPPMRGRGFFRGRGGPRGFGPNNGPNFDNNWGPMGPPPPGMMGGPPPFGPPPGMMPPGGPMGPPPNMMGQPPPFGGPPGMPPPNLDSTQLWVETKSDDGKSYYYHARTRETTWTRPQEGPSCKVITQADMETMVASGQMPNMGGQSMMNGPMGGPPMGGPPMGGPPMGGPPMGGPPMGGPPMGMMPNGMMGGMMPPGVAPPTSSSGPPPFMSQPPPWVKDSNKDKNSGDNGSPSDAEDTPPGDSTPSANGGNNMMPFSGGPNFPGGPGGPGFPGPGPGGFGGAWGGWGGWPPPLVAHPPPNLATAAVPDSGAASQQAVAAEDTAQQSPPHAQPAQSASDETVVPAELAARAAEWTAHKAPDGRPYYYNAGTQESVWKKPKPMKDLEDLQAKIAIEKGEKPEKSEQMDVDESKVEVIDVEAHAEAAAAASAAAEAEVRAAAERERAEAERAEAERAEKERADKEKADKEKAKQDESRPICVKPISGTPWCVVWMRDGRMFYHNPAGLLSVWQRPEQLIGRADVDHLISQPLLNLQRKEGAASSQPELKRAASTDSEDSDADRAKKTKPPDTPVAGGRKAGVIDAGKEAAIEAETRAALDRALVPLEQRMRSFREMLHERNVSAFSTWEKELYKIVFDCRYLMLPSKERKQAFDKYVRERAEEERKEKKNRLQQKKQAFRQLMEEAKLDSKSSFTEFSSKHGRDERFKGIDKPRNRETYFNEYLAEVRKKEKEEKEKKREQVKSDFIALLKEKSVDRHARWAEVKKKVDSEPRYKAVEGSTLREDYFREYCKIVKEERKKEKDGKEKEKERERSSSKKDKKDKDRDKEKDKEGRSKESKKEKKKEKSDKPETGEEKQPTPPPDQWAEILGIPGEEDSKESRSTKSSTKTRESSDTSKSKTPEKDISPKVLRSSKKEPQSSPEKKSPIKSPPKKRKTEFKSPEPEKKTKRSEKPEKTDKKKKKKSEKD